MYKLEKERQTEKSLGLKLIVSKRLQELPQGTGEKGTKSLHLGHVALVVLSLWNMKKVGYCYSIYIEC